MSSVLERTKKNGSKSGRTEAKVGRVTAPQAWLGNGRDGLAAGRLFGPYALLGMDAGTARTAPIPLLEFSK